MNKDQTNRRVKYNSTRVLEVMAWYNVKERQGLWWGQRKFLPDT